MFEEMTISVGGGPGNWCQKCYTNHPDKRKVCGTKLKQWKDDVVREKFKAEFNPDEADYYDPQYPQTKEDSLDEYIEHYHSEWLEEKWKDESNFSMTICDGKVVKKDLPGCVIARERFYPELDAALEKLNRLKSRPKSNKTTKRRRRKDRKGLSKYRQPTKCSSPTNF
jgi:hypothetical protein